MNNRNGVRSNILRVVTYHRVAEPNERPWLNPGLISATPDLFAQQMDVLAREYQVVSMHDVLAAVREGRRLPERAVLITFDDGYRDFAEHAWPILKQRNLPATVFVPTAYPDQPQRQFWWDKLHQVFARVEQEVLEDTPVGALSLRTEADRRQSMKRFQNYIKTLRHEEAMRQVDALFAQVGPTPPDEPAVLGWEALRRLAGEGVVLAAHTQTHPVLNRTTVAHAREEIVGSQADLERHIGAALPVFSYPDGGHNEAVMQILKEEGFLLAFNGPAGDDDLATGNPLRIRRVNITRRTTPWLLRVRLARWFVPVERFRLRKRIAEITEEPIDA